ncbi:phage tail protein I [Rhodoplanes sp. TEM]|uniref:Phage tail protein I n=1 Tax=Rhodoplanes tepidamans TaxID=200616 RepID=A0ABT5J564_RHOTP|nr:MULTISPECIES: phage tail protein I [Rhodoplanes]MDC7784767.1 phage tail protein I [Rhodoplanes tepidamans]MDC7982234.1 phage tail protein I [Rhodoplanes sp. TEM]MDQ0356241.1 hypothetical protein [Rhodoplanes tepidamans]
MIPYELHLLPVNASSLEQVISSAGQRVQVIPTPIETVKGPYTAPLGFLTFDAWEYSADLWKSGWPETLKRVVTASWFTDHSLKGTERAISRYCFYVGSALLKVTKPPSKFFLSPAWTKTEREAWLQSLPQIRVWDLKQRGKRKHLMFAGSKTFKAFFEGHWVAPSDARFRLERRAELIIDGEHRPVDVDGLGNQADRVRIRDKATSGFFLGVPRRQRFATPSTAAERVITFTFVGQPAHGIRFPVRPGLEVKSVIPDLIFEHGRAPASIFPGRPLNKKFLVPSGASLRIYSRIAMWDNDRVPPARKALAFAGVGRLGMPPHTAELKVSIPGRRSSKAFGRFMTGHLIAADRERWRDTFTAVRSAKRLSDKLQVNSKTYRPFRIGSVIRIGGSYKLGRWTRS